MDYTAVVDQAVKQFYADGNNEVHTWLLRVQASPEAWTFVWELLDPSKVRSYFNSYFISSNNFN